MYLLTLIPLLMVLTKFTYWERNLITKDNKNIKYKLNINLGI